MYINGPFSGMCVKLICRCRKGNCGGMNESCFNDYDVELDMTQTKHESNKGFTFLHTSRMLIFLSLFLFTPIL